MNPPEYNTFARPLALIVALGACGATLAQTEEADQDLQEITIENQYGEQNIEADEQDHGYRFIEDDDVDDWEEPLPQRESEIDELRRLYGL